MINKTLSKFSIFYCSLSELLLQKIKILLLLAVFTASSFNVFAQNSSLISNCSDFVAGSNSAWPYVLVATTIADGSVSQGAQTFTMNVTDTSSGTNIRVAKTTANGNWFFGPAIALTLGSNSITVAAVTFDRTVKFQFSSGDAEFDALILNGDTSNCVVPPPPSPSSSSLISACSDFVAGSNSAWPYVLVATTIADGSVSQGAQTFIMNVTDTANGANVRVYKTTANGNDFFGNPVTLTLGSNSITVAAVAFDRAVKFQFSSGDVEFDALILNGDTSNCVGLPPPPPPPSTSSLINVCSDFVAGSNPAWPYVLIATTVDSGSVSQGAQTFIMNVTDTANGANVRVYKTTANGNDFFGNPVALTLGSNSITVAAVAFDRAVKFQFSSGDVEFDALNLNGVDSDCIANISAINEYDDVFLNIFPNPSYGDLFIKSNDPIEFLEIKDLSGRVVLKMTPQKSKVHIQTSQLKNSLYFLKCLTNKEWITRKIILN